jgi:hypothetical protein
MTGIPKRRYYAVLIVLMVGSVFAFGAMFYYVRAKDRTATEATAARIAAQAAGYDYRSCLDRNELRSVIYVILQGALERPAPPAATPGAREQERAYRALIRSYLVGGELTPQDCEQILRREGHP